MSDIPLISITQEDTDEDTADEVSKLNINESYTDTEDLVIEQDKVRFRKSPKSGNALVDIIKPTMNGSVTDVEDCTDSEDDEDEEEVKSAKEVDIVLDSFLDQGYVDEMTKSSSKGHKPKTLTRCFSKAAESDTLQVFVDTSGALTDCEDCDLSDDDDSLGNASIPDCPDDVLTRENDNDAVDIRNQMKRKQEKHFHKQEVVDGSSSESDNEGKMRHRKCHRKTEERPRSDCENFSLSDEEMAGACAKPTSRQSALFEAEELSMEGSDVEEDRTQTFPEINITFVSDDRNVPVETVRKDRPTTLTVQVPDPDEALTDVENLDSSESENEQQPRAKRLIPRAVVRNVKPGGLTDVEDFNDSDDNEEQEQKREVAQEFLPSPVREIAILKLDRAGEQTQDVMPLNQGLLTAGTPDVKQALTDVEDMSDNEDPGEMYDSSKYTTESLPEVEHGDVYSSDNSCVRNSARLEIICPEHEPLTDTEELFLDRNTATNSTGNELRRRRKPKLSHTHSPTNSSNACQQFKGKKFLEMKLDTAAATTDVEDLYLSDDGVDESRKSRQVPIQQPSNLTMTSNYDAKTDVEFLSGDELVNEQPLHSHPLPSEGFTVTFTAQDQDGDTTKGLMGIQPIPMIRQISPSPDTQNCNTDCEDIQVISDGEDHGIGPDGSYSRAQTATPFELTRALDESGSSEVHEISTRPKNELLDVKGMIGNEHQEIHTDVEFLEDDAVNAADQ